MVSVFGSYERKWWKSKEEGNEEARKPLERKKTSHV
jgi:hypothetical protein